MDKYECISQKKKKNSYIPEMFTMLANAFAGMDESLVSESDLEKQKNTMMLLSLSGLVIGLLCESIKHMKHCSHRTQEHRITEKTSLYQKKVAPG